MGMYTKFHLDFEFRRDTPTYVFNVIRAMMDQRGVKDEFPEILKDFPCRWEFMLHSDRFNTSRFNVDCGNTYRLVANGYIKDYESEIQKFVEFVKPWVEFRETTLGTMQYEEFDKPTVIYLNEHGDIEYLQTKDEVDTSDWGYHIAQCEERPGAWDELA